MAKRPEGDVSYVKLVAPDGTVYAAGTEVGSSVEIMGDALTALEASATANAAMALAIGTTADTSADPTVIGLLKLIAENTTPAP